MTIGKDSNNMKYTFKDQELQKVKEKKYQSYYRWSDFDSHISEKINKVTKFLYYCIDHLVVGI